MIELSQKHIIRKVKPKDAARAAEVARSRFGSSSVQSWVLYPNETDEEKKKQLLEYYWWQRVYAYALIGGAYEVDDFKGVAFWIPPGLRKKYNSTLFSFRSKRYKLRRMMDQDARNHFDHFQKTLKEKASEVLGDKEKDTWYLAIIAVDQAYEGRGCASALIRCIFDLADKHSQYCFLEAKEEAAPKYYKLGFQKVEDMSYGYQGLPTEGQIRAGHPPDKMIDQEFSMALMVRNPKKVARKVPSGPTMRDL